MCPRPEPSAKKGIIALKDTSHFTIAASDPTTVQMYLDLFGFKPMVYQAPTTRENVSRLVRFQADGLSGADAGMASRQRRPLPDVHRRRRSDARRRRRCGRASCRW